MVVSKKCDGIFVGVVDLEGFFVKVVKKVKNVIVKVN